MRSLIGENQVLDSDFLSEAEFAVASGIINTKIADLDTKITTVSGILQQLIEQKTFLSLLDTPTTFSGAAGKSVIISEGEDGLIFTTISGGDGLTEDTLTEEEKNFSIAIALALGY